MFVNCIRQDARRQPVRNFSARRVVNVWNALPDTVCFISLAGFSQSFKDIDLSTDLRCY